MLICCEFLCLLGLASPLALSVCPRQSFYPLCIAFRLMRPLRTLGTTGSINPSKLGGQLEYLPPHFPANLVLMRRSSSRVIALALAAGVVLSACSSTDRSAAPAEEVVVSEQASEFVEPSASETESEMEQEELGVEVDLEDQSGPLSASVGSFMPDTKTCPDKSSFTVQRRVTNELPFPIVLSAGEYSCNDWSGVSTPGRAFDNLLLEPGESKSVTLEAADNVSRNWTLAVKQEGANGFLGKLRMSIPISTGNGQTAPLKVAGSRKISAPDGSGRKTEHCDVLDLSRTNEPDTPGSRWNWYFPSDMVSFVVRDGSVTAVSDCAVSAAAP